MSSTTAAPSTKRQQSSTTIPTAKPTFKIHSLAVIADRAQLTGTWNIEIGENTIIHPHAKLMAEHGNLVIGKNCIIAEKAVVGAAAPSGSNEKTADTAIGDDVSIESSALVSGTRVGEHSTIGVNASIGAGAVVGKWCKVSPLCEVGEGEVLEDFTVVFGYGERRVDSVLRDQEETRDMRMKGRVKEIELLKTLIPDGGAKWRE